MVRTSINLGTEEFEMLLNAATKHGMRIETLILLLMRTLAHALHKELILHTAAQYQDPRSPENWKCVHVTWEGNEYEFLIDMRKVHKKSVSRLIAEAIHMYLNDDTTYEKTIMDNYLYHDYKISKNIIQNKIECTFNWIFIHPLKTD